MIDPESQPERITVVCPTCRARLNPRVEWIGRRVRCPDCHSAVEVIPPPAETVAKPLRNVGQYGVRQEGQRQDEAAPDPEVFLMVCPLCHARMHPRLSQVGKRVRCPDCDKVLRIKPPPPPEPAPKAPRPVGEYHMGVEPPRVEAPMEFLVVQGVLQDEPPPEPPPRVWFASGVFSFPWRLEAVGRWVILSVLATLAGVVTSGVFLAGFSSSGVQVGSMAAPLLVVPTVWLWVWTLSYGSVCFLAILQDTAAGCDVIHNWPEPDWRQWAWPMLQLMYVVGLALAFSYLVCWPIGYFIGNAWLAMAMLLVALWMGPFLLLSGLEAGSILSLWSPPVIRSLVANAGAWILVYAELLAVVGVPLALIAVGAAFSPIGAPLAGCWLLAAGSLIAARLIGRLAWRIGQSATRRPKKRA